MDVIDFLSDPVARRRSFLRRRGTVKKFDSAARRRLLLYDLYVSEMDMDWVNPRIGSGWVGSGRVQFLCQKLTQVWWPMSFSVLHACISAGVLWLIPKRMKVVLDVKIATDVSYFVSKVSTDPPSRPHAGKGSVKLSALTEPRSPINRGWRYSQY